VGLCPEGDVLASWLQHEQLINWIHSGVGRVVPIKVSTDSGYVHTDASPSPGFRLRFTDCLSLVQASVHPHEWSVRGHLYKHITQRVSVDTLQ